MIDGNTLNKQVARLQRVRNLAIAAFLFLSPNLLAQMPDFPPFDSRHWGVVLDHPGTRNVNVNQDVPYLKDDKGTLALDIYSPPDVKPGELLPAIIFLNGIGEQSGEAKVKSWGIYRTWPRLIASYGYIGISMEADGARIQESIDGVFKFLNDQGKNHNIDANRLGVYAASANVNQSGIYLMKPDAYKGIKAAVLYYGGVPQGPFRKDLPVLFVISEGDVGRGGYTNLWTEVLKNNAPWTITMASGLPHAFDAFSDHDDARIIVKETISFWKDQLDPIPAPSWPHSIQREIVEAGYAHDYAKAASLLKPWTEEHPTDADALGSYANALKNSGNYPEAEGVYKRYLKQKPADVNMQTELAALEYTLNKPAEAEAVIKMTEKSGPLPRNAYVGLGTTLYHIKNYERSAYYYEKALAIEPRGMDFYNVACSYALNNQKDKAFSNLNKAMELGFNSKQQFENDADLASLKSDTRYREMLNRLK